jgi:hypothetical protein
MVEDTQLWSSMTKTKLMQKLDGQIGFFKKNVLQCDVAGRVRKTIRYWPVYRSNRWAFFIF